eukprot:5303648-Pleurochrysis_carterae.AAC.1
MLSAQSLIIKHATKSIRRCPYSTAGSWSTAPMLFCQSLEHGAHCLAAFQDEIVEERVITVEGPSKDSKMPSFFKEDEVRDASRLAANCAWRLEALFREADQRERDAL